MKEPVTSQAAADSGIVEILNEAKSNAFRFGGLDLFGWSAEHHAELAHRQHQLSAHPHLILPEEGYVVRREIAHVLDPDLAAVAAGESHCDLMRLVERFLEIFDVEDQPFLGPLRRILV